MRKISLCFVLLIVIIYTSACSGGYEPPAINDTDIPATSETQTSESEVVEQTEANTEETTEPYVFSDVSFSIGSISSSTGEFFDNKTRIATKEYIPIEKIRSFTVGDGYSIAWFAYNKDKQYIGNGTNAFPSLPTGSNWMSSGKDLDINTVLIWNNNTKYIRIALRNVRSAQIDAEKDILLSEFKINLIEQGDGDGNLSVFEYTGESLGTSNKVGIKKVGQISGPQDGAVFGNYIFSLGNSGGCKVYAADTFLFVSSFDLDKVSLSKPHSNSVCFGTLKYSESDEFPLLYCNIYNNYGIKDKEQYGVCNVYRILRNGNSFKSMLVQVIKIGFTDNTEVWASEAGDTRPYGNFVIDTDREKLIAFTMRDEDMSTRFFEFDIPTLDEGELDSRLGIKRVTLGLSDVSASYKCEYSYYVQGCTYYDGKIFSLEGKTDSETNKPSMKVIDVSKQALVSELKLSEMGFWVEPESAYFINGELYYMNVKGELFKFDFH